MPSGEPTANAVQRTGDDQIWAAVVESGSKPPAVSCLYSVIRRRKAVALVEGRGFMMEAHCEELNGVCKQCDCAKLRDCRPIDQLSNLSD